MLDVCNPSLTGFEDLSLPLVIFPMPLRVSQVRSNLCRFKPSWTYRRLPS